MKCKRIAFKKFLYIPNFTCNGGRRVLSFVIKGSFIIFWWPAFISSLKGQLTAYIALLTKISIDIQSNRIEQSQVACQEEYWWLWNRHKFPTNIHCNWSSTTSFSLEYNILFSLYNKAMAGITFRLYLLMRITLKLWNFG